MGRKRRERVRDEDVTGLKYFHKLRPMLDRLHEVGCQRDKAGNRRLHFDQSCVGQTGRRDGRFPGRIVRTYAARRRGAPRWRGTVGPCRCGPGTAPLGVGDSAVRTRPGTSVGRRPDAAGRAGESVDTSTRTADRRTPSRSWCAARTAKGRIERNGLHPARVEAMDDLADPRRRAVDLLGDVPIADVRPGKENDPSAPAVDKIAQLVFHGVQSLALPRVELPCSNAFHGGASVF